MHGRSINNCPLCPSQPVVQTVVASPVVLASTGGAALVEPVRIPDKPEITNPEAKKALELADALEKVSTMTDTVAGIRNLLKSAEAELKLAADTRDRALQALTKVPPKLRKSRTPKIQTQLDEHGNFDGSYGKI